MQEANFFIGYFLGALSSGLFLYAGICLSRQIGSHPPEPDKPRPHLFSFGAPRAQKKKPKSIDDFDLWKREQREAPLDPGSGF